MKILKFSIVAILLSVGCSDSDKSNSISAEQGQAPKEKQEQTLDQKEEILALGKDSTTIKISYYKHKTKYYQSTWKFQFKMDTVSEFKDILFRFLIGAANETKEAKPVSELDIINVVQYNSLGWYSFPKNYEAYCRLVEYFNKNLGCLKSAVLRRSDTSKLRPFELIREYTRVLPVSKERFKKLGKDIRIKFVYAATWRAFLSDKDYKYELEFEFPLAGRQTVELNKQLDYSNQGNTRIKKNDPKNLVKVEIIREN